MQPAQRAICLTSEHRVTALDLVSLFGVGDLPHAAIRPQDQVRHPDVQPAVQPACPRLTALIQPKVTGIRRPASPSSGRSRIRRA